MTADGWELVVGVPLEAWRAADTPERFAALLEARDNPPPPPPPPVPIGWDSFDILDDLGNIVARRRIPRYDLTSCELPL